MRDTLFNAHRDLVDFRFDDAVAAVFPDMIRRSVPGYGEVITLSGLLAGEYAQPGSLCYDLGCSLGATTLAMRRQIRAADCRIVGVDNAPAMIDQCRINLAALPSDVPVDLRCTDLRDCPVENASVVAMNFTLQFVPPAERHAVLQRIHTGLRPGGVLLLAEKVAYEEPDEQRFQEAMHLAFKRANGYSELEISGKRNALEKVMIPDSPEAVGQRLAAAGFNRHWQWLRCFNFAAWVAFK
jgi:tRNA (cmo5U34)-methyltransferase